MYSSVLKADGSKSGLARIVATESMRSVSVVNQCPRCLHLNRANPVTCAAFPKGIPLVILMGEYDHTFEFTVGGEDDQGVTFSPI